MQLSKLQDEIDGLHKKIDVLEYQNEQQHEELKRLQQKGKTRYTYGLTTHSHKVRSYVLLTAMCNKLRATTTETTSGNE